MAETEEERTLRRKRERYLRDTGRPMLVRGVPHQRMQQKIRSYHARGMSYVQMAAQTGLPERTVRESDASFRRGMKRATFAALAGMTFEEPEDHVWVPALGTRRRLGGLWRDGYPMPFLSDALDYGNRRYIQSVVIGEKASSYVRAKTRRDVEALSEKLVGTTPEAFGIEPRKVKFCQTFAIKRGLVPSHCWDFETIDDPAAFPEWTGECGTPNGALIHERESIPLCDRCRLAAGSSEWAFSGEKLKALRERHGLSQRALEAQLGLTKGHCHHWEHGRYAPRKQVLARLLSALDATFEDVMEDE